jgi:hypothetical protein
MKPASVVEMPSMLGVADIRGYTNVVELRQERRRRRFNESQIPKVTEVCRSRRSWRVEMATVSSSRPTCRSHQMVVMIDVLSCVADSQDGQVPCRREVK